jgi:hypothetical protein
MVLTLTIMIILASRKKKKVESTESSLPILQCGSCNISTLDLFLTPSTVPSRTNISSCLFWNFHQLREHKPLKCLYGSILKTILEAETIFNPEYTPPDRMSTMTTWKALELPAFLVIALYD